MLESSATRLVALLTPLYTEVRHLPLLDVEPFRPHRIEPTQ